MSKHHKISLPAPILPIDLKPVWLFLKVILVKVFPNGHLVDKEDDLLDAFTENIDTNTILFIAAANYLKNNYVLLHLYGKGNNCLLIRGAMTEIMDLLSPGNFIQIHDSCIINKNFAVSICPHYEINLLNFELPLPIGRIYSDKVDKLLFPNCTYHYGKNCPNKKVL